MPASRYLSLLALALSLAAPTSALGEPGVTVDPRSPAGQEYAVPVDAARQLGGSRPATGTPTGQAVAPSGAIRGAATPQLFGEGVEPPPGAGQSAQRRPGDESASPTVPQAASERAPGTVSPRADGRTPREVSQAADASASPGPTGPAVTPNAGARSMGTSALVVLLGGALLALALRLVARRGPARRPFS